MKLFFSISILSLGIFVSCGTSDQQQLSMSAIDTTKVFDSATLIEQQKAIGNIKFGISEVQFEKEKKLFLKTTEFNKWENSELLYNKIGEYEFSQMTGSFAGDSLYKVYIIGASVNYESFDLELSPQYYSLLESLKIKYGAPVYEIPLPSWTTVDKGYYKVCSRWIIGEKTVETRLSCSGIYYSIDLVSFKHDVFKRIDSQERSEKQNNIKTGAGKL